MNTRRITIACAAALAVAGLAAGCGSSSADTSTGAVAAASPSKAPADVLVASTKQLDAESYHYTLKAGGFSGGGAVDPANHSASMSYSGSTDGVTMKFDLTEVDTDVYLKMDLGDMGSQLGIRPDKWMHIDASKLTADNDLLAMTPNGSDVADLLSGMADVTSNDGRTMTGTLDLTKAGASDMADSDALKQAGDKAKAVPFTAQLDDKGRLSSLKVDGSGIVQDLTIDMAFTQYGEPADISKPASADVVEAPDDLMQMFTN